MFGSLWSQIARAAAQQLRPSNAFHHDGTYLGGATLGAIAGSEIALTFLGVGVHDPTPSFGALIFAFNLLGDALNDVFTPRTR